MNGHEEGTEALQVCHKLPCKHTWPLYGGPPDKGLCANTGKVHNTPCKDKELSSLYPLRSSVACNSSNSTCSGFS